MAGKSQRKLKESKKGGKTSQEAQEAEGSPIEIDDGPIRAKTPTNDVGKETQRLDNGVARCKAGVAWVDLLNLKNQLVFGKYNDRPENDGERQKLIASFKAAGIVSMKETSAIPMILDVKRIKKDVKLAANFDEPSEVPELLLEDTDPIIVASGQHRVSALVRYHQALTDELGVLEKKRAKIAGTSNDSGRKPLTADDKKTYMELREEIAMRKGQLEGMGKWGVIIYSEEALLAKGDALANHLSRNNSLHEFKETAEEVLVTIFKKMMATYKSSPDNSREEATLRELATIRTASEKNARLQKVLHNDALCMMLATRLMKLGTHVRRRREFSVTWLAKSLGVCMGLYVRWINIRCETLRRLGSRKEFPSYEEVDRLLEDVEKGKQEAKDEVKKLRARISKPVAEEDSDLGMWAEVMGELDKDARRAFSEKPDEMETMTPGYVMALCSYRQDVHRTLKEAWFKHGAEVSDNEFTVHLDRVMARVAIYLTPEEGNTRAPEPLLCGFRLDYAWSRMTSVEKGIEEICRWIEPQLDYWRYLHPKSHTMDDWSEIMMQNLVTDPRFLEKDMPEAMTDLIWNYRASLVLTLHNRMVVVNRSGPRRPTDKTAFTDKYNNLPDGDHIACQALVQMVVTKRGKSPARRDRDMTKEETSVAGIMGLHATGWDWLSPTLKNPSRDIEPSVRAITLERVHMKGYRPSLLKEKHIGALRMLIEIELKARIRKVQTIGRNGLEITQRWVWWDELVLKDSQQDPLTVVNNIQKTFEKKQQQQQQRLTMESNDRDAITKVINTIAGLPCARATSSKHSLMSADLLKPLINLAEALEMNSARLRLRALNEDDTMEFKELDDIVDLMLKYPEAQDDEYTIYATDEQVQAPEDVPKTSKSKGKGKAPPSDAGPSNTSNKKGSGKEDVSASDINTPRTVVKPRPVKRKAQIAKDVVMTEGEPSSGQHEVPIPNVESDVTCLTPAMATVALAGAVDQSSSKTDDPHAVTSAVATVPSAEPLNESEVAAPSPAVATVAPASSPLQELVPVASAVATVVLAQNTPQAADVDAGFSVSDVGWVEQENNDNTDVDMVGVVDTPRNQPSSLPSRSPSPDDTIIDAAPAPPTGTKRSRATTGSSTSSSGGPTVSKKRSRTITMEGEDVAGDEVEMMTDI